MSNLKVHFAGAEVSGILGCLREGGANYVLGSVFPFIIKQYEKENKEYPHLEVVDILNQFKGKILDSGIYSLVYGSQQKDFTEETWWKWQETYIDFVKTSGFKGNVIEVDAQKLIGADKTWTMRESMVQSLPDHQIINVWHKQDGKKGLDRMIEYSDYMAISMIEIRKLYGHDYSDFSKKLTGYIMNKKPSIKIHLLACTEFELLSDLDYCTSADSTAWLALNKYGTGKYIKDGKMEILTKDQALSIKPNYREKAIEIHKELWPGKPIKEGSLDWIGVYLLQVDELIKIYSKYAGSQN